MLIGILIKVSVNLKVIGPVYFIPILVFLYLRDGVRPILKVLSVSAVISALPFLQASRGRQSSPLRVVSG
jgi:hypothetical protein